MQRQLFSLMLHGQSCQCLQFLTIYSQISSIKLKEAQECVDSQRTTNSQALLLTPEMMTVKRTLLHRQEVYYARLTDVQRLETALDIVVWWTQHNTAFHAAVKAKHETSYCCAWNLLAHAVVEQIIELGKIGLPGTCKLASLP